MKFPNPLMIAVLLVGCGTSEQRVSSESPPQEATQGQMSTEISPAKTPPAKSTGNAHPATAQMPRTIHADVHLPGTDASRFLTATIENNAGSWSMSGCISAVRGACNRTRQIPLTVEDVQTIRTEIFLFMQTPVSCAQPQPGPTDRTYRLIIDNGQMDGFLPADPAAIPQYTDARVCDAMNRLAWWITQRFQAL